MEVDYQALGRRISRYRESKGWTQAKLAEMAKVEPNSLSNIERAAVKVKLDTLVNIVNALGVSVDDVLCDSIVVEREAYENELVRMTQDCTPKELRIVADTLVGMKEVLKTHLRDEK